MVRGPGECAEWEEERTGREDAAEDGEAEASPHGAARREDQHVAVAVRERFRPGRFRRKRDETVETMVEEAKRKLSPHCTCEGHEHSLSLLSDCLDCDCCPHMRYVEFVKAPEEGFDW